MKDLSLLFVHVLIGKQYQVNLFYVSLSSNEQIISSEYFVKKTAFFSVSSSEFKFKFPRTALYRSNLLETERKTFCSKVVNLFCI